MKLLITGGGTGGTYAWAGDSPRYFQQKNARIVKSRVAGTEQGLESRLRSAGRHPLDIWKITAARSLNPKSNLGIKLAFTQNTVCQNERKKCLKPISRLRHWRGG